MYCTVISKMYLFGCAALCGFLLKVSAVDLQFPANFKFGAATAAYQIEGAWNISDKAPSIWDTFLHEKSSNDTGDVACDSYHNWRRDIEIASELGLKFYRFSISWPRLLPSGFSNHISEDGKQYYNNLINGLLDKGIEPVITLYHWDLPQTLQNLGGWTNPLISEWYAEYSRVAFSLYSDRVQTWITMNEPLTFCTVAYGLGTYAPGIISPGVGDYLCAKHALIAHAKAWRIYDEGFRPKYNGKVGITNAVVWFEPEADDDGAAESMMQLFTGIYSHAIFSGDGGWPPTIEKVIAENSREEGHLRSRLPRFTPEEITLVKGTFDFYGLNFYTSRLARKAAPDEMADSVFGFELNVVHSVSPEWKKTAAPWFFVYYEGMRKKLSWLKRNYGDIEILITENGYPTSGYNLDDKDRTEYLLKNLEQVSRAIHEDGVNVVGYTAWSLIDNLEWADGFDMKFGLYEVDFEAPDRKRTVRASGRAYADLIAVHSVNMTSKPIYDEF